MLLKVETKGRRHVYEVQIYLNDLDMIYVSGPGCGGPAVVGNTYLEGTYSEIYPKISRDEAGLRKLFIQFSFPGGIPSHASPECPGSIHEGGRTGLFAQPLGNDVGRYRDRISMPGALKQTLGQLSH